MSNDKMREEFEAEMVADGKSILRFQDSYYFSTIHRKWLFWKKAWQASRADVVVELPPTPEAPEAPEEAIDDSHMDAYHSAVRMRKACAQSITSVGLKVKP